MKVRLQIGVATVFALLTTIVLSIVVAVLYFGNRELALRTARYDRSKNAICRKHAGNYTRDSTCGWLFGQIR